MSEAPSVLQTQFEGVPLHVLAHDRRSVWIAREIGTAMGYAQDGKRLVSLVTDTWSDEFLPGHDYTCIDGDDLAALKASVGPEVIPPNTASVLVLYESGVHLILTKTSKPVGRRLRRFLVDEVLPALARGQLVQPHSAVMVSEAVRWFHNLRLARRVDLDDRKFRSQALRTCVHVLHSLGRLDDQALAQWEVRVAEIALGRALPSLGGPRGDVAQLARPRSIEGLADDLGVTRERVRRASTQLGLADGPGPVFDDVAALAIEALLSSQGFVQRRAA